MVADRTVMVRPMGGKPKVISVSRQTLISRVLEMAEVSTDGSINILGDGEDVSLDQRIEDIEELVVVPAVKGGM